MVTYRHISISPWLKHLMRPDQQQQKKHLPSSTSLQIVNRITKQNTPVIQHETWRFNSHGQMLASQVGCVALFGCGNQTSGAAHLAQRTPETSVTGLCVVRRCNTARYHVAHLSGCSLSGENSLPFARFRCLLQTKELGGGDHRALW